MSLEVASGRKMRRFAQCSHCATCKGRAETIKASVVILGTKPFYTLIGEVIFDFIFTSEKFVS